MKPIFESAKHAIIQFDDIVNSDLIIRLIQEYCQNVN